MKRAFLLSLLLLLALLVFKMSNLTFTRPPSEIYDLSSSQLEALKDQALHHDDSEAAWKLWRYYVFTKNDQFKEGERWKAIGAKLDAERLKTKSNRQGSGPSK